MICHVLQQKELKKNADARVQKNSSQLGNSAAVLLHRLNDFGLFFVWCSQIRFAVGYRFFRGSELIVSSLKVCHTLAFNDLNHKKCFVSRLGFAILFASRVSCHRQV